MTKDDGTYFRKQIFDCTGEMKISLDPRDGIDFRIRRLSRQTSRHRSFDRRAATTIHCVLVTVLTLSLARQSMANSVAPLEDAELFLFPLENIGGDFQDNPRPRQSIRQEWVARKLCNTHVTTDVKEVCCRNCTKCLPPINVPCEKGEVSCTCNADQECLKAQQSWDDAEAEKGCEQAVEKCRDVPEMYNDTCERCETQPDSTYVCGESCEETALQNTPTMVDCMIPGNCTTLTTKTECAAELKCRSVKVPNEPVCETLEIQDCTKGTEDSQICAQVDVQRQNCTTVPVVIGETCKQPQAQDDSQCREIIDGTKEECTEAPVFQRNCTAPGKMEQNCTLVVQNGPPVCVTAFQESLDCDGLAQPEGLRDGCTYVYETERKCEAVEKEELVCPTKEMKFCADTQQRVQIPGSCKSEPLQCLARSLEQLISTAVGTPSATRQAQEDCRKNSTVCDYEIRTIQECITKNVTIFGATCSKVPVVEEKCHEEKIPKLVCQGTPTTPVATYGKVKFRRPNVSPNHFIGFLSRVFSRAQSPYEPCRILRNPVTKCVSPDNTKRECTYQIVPENCTEAESTTKVCREVPNRKTVCTSTEPSNTICTPYFRNDTSCITIPYKEDACGNKQTPNCSCKARTITQCRPGGATSIEVCERVEDTSTTSCPTAVNSVTTCEAPRRGKCEMVEAGGKAAALSSNNCQPKFCVKKGLAKCEFYACEKTRLVPECRTEKEARSCNNTSRPVCPKTCTRPAIRCVMSSCETPVCTRQ